MKCGTSTLFANISNHPSVVPAFRKEVHFFDYPKNFAKGFRWYLAHFPLAHRWSFEDRLGRRRPMITGEASPYYSFHPLACQRIKERLPEVKIIFLIRNPVDRAYSHHQHECRLGYEVLSFEEAIAAENDRLAGEEEKFRADPWYYSYAHQHWSYLKRGHYVDQIRTWALAFSPEQVLVLELEQVSKDPQGAFSRIFDFLEVPRYRVEQLKPLNAGRYQALKPETRQKLERYFAPFNQELSTYLGRALPW